MHFYSVRLLFIMFLAMLICISLQAQIAENMDIDKSKIRGSYPIHGSDLLWEQELELQKYLQQHPEARLSNALRKTSAWGFIPGSAVNWYADDLSVSPSTRYLVPSTCRAVGTNCYIFVEDASWSGGYVTQAAVDSVREYFDSKTPANPSKGIFQMDVDAFGNPPDVDTDPRIIILLLDIKDGYSGFGGYVVGYFYSYNEINLPTSNQAEIFFIDTNPNNLNIDEGLYDGISTLAHEFQHMIHYNYDPFEITFVNESFSTLAEVHCGFPIYSPSLYANEPNHYLLDWRGTDADAVLTDYSRSARFSVYLRDQAGIGVFKYIIASSQHGTNGIDEGLSASGSSLRFNEILPNWFIANILDDTTVDPQYGYIYPNLPKAVERTFFNPNVTSTTDTVKNYAVQYLNFAGGSQLKATFSTGAPALVIKAVEIGPSSKRVLNVTNNVEFSEPDFGTTYTEVHFVVMNTDPSSQAIYTYTASGTGGFAATTLYYASDGVYYMALPHPSSNQKFATRFTPTISGQLYAVSVKFNEGLKAIEGSGNLQVSAHQNIAGSIAGIPGAQIGTSVLVPFSQLVRGSWNEINMQAANVSAIAGTDFHIVLEVIGTIGDTLQFMLDDGFTTPTNRTSSYRIGNLGLGWYNRADPDYGSGKAVSYENLLLKAILAVPTAVNDEPQQSSIPRHYALTQNYPNPFNPSTIISYQLPGVGTSRHSGTVSLRIYDLLGREVAILVDGIKEAGYHTATFNGSKLSSGIYFYRLKAGNYISTRKMLLIK